MDQTPHPQINVEVFAWPAESSAKNATQVGDNTERGVRGVRPIHLVWRGVFSGSPYYFADPTLKAVSAELAPLFLLYFSFTYF